MIASFTLLEFRWWLELCFFCAFCPVRSFCLWATLWLCMAPKTELGMLNGCDVRSVSENFKIVYVLLYDHDDYHPKLKTKFDLSTNLNGEDDHLSLEKAFLHGWDLFSLMLPYSLSACVLCVITSVRLPCLFMDSTNHSYKILSWNVRGMYNFAREEEFRQLIQTIRPDLICLQEIKMENVTAVTISNALGSQYDGNFLFHPSNGASGGILLAANDSVVQL
jgi:hypothetical protein